MRVDTALGLNGHSRAHWKFSMRGGIMFAGLSYSFRYKLFGAEFDFLLDKAKPFIKPYWF